MTTITRKAEPAALALQHLHLVPAVAHKLGLDRTRRPAAPVDHDDYLAAGAEALVRATQAWQPDGGSPLVPYIWAAISWAMRAEQRQASWRRQADPRGDRRLVSLHAPTAHAGDPGATVVDRLADPAAAHQASLVELRVAVQAAVARLRPTLQEVVRLYWLADLPQQEVAERVGISQPAVAMRLRAARRELAAMLGEVLAA
jgi:RNA polymerase sigma factor (sigma-70 family)